MIEHKNFEIQKVGNFPPKIGEYSHFWAYNKSKYKLKHQMVQIKSGEWVACRASYVIPLREEKFVSVHGKIIKLGKIVEN